MKENVVEKRYSKNQIIITALAVMIAVAGYINYSDSRLKTQSAKSSDNSEKTEGDSRYRRYHGGDRKS